MARVRFLADFDWRPPERNGRVVIAYKAGYEGSVRRACCDAAVAAGVAEEITAEITAERMSSESPTVLTDLTSEPDDAAGAD